MKLVKVCCVLINFCFAQNATILGMWHSGSASALHAEGQGFNPPHLHYLSIFEWSRVRLTLGAFSTPKAQWQSV